VSPLLALAVPDSESLLMPILAAVSNWKMFKKNNAFISSIKLNSTLE